MYAIVFSSDWLQAADQRIAEQPMLHSWAWVTQIGFAFSVLAPSLSSYVRVMKYTTRLATESTFRIALGSRQSMCRSTKIFMLGARYELLQIP